MLNNSVPPHVKEFIEIKYDDTSSDFGVEKTCILLREAIERKFNMEIPTLTIYRIALGQLPLGTHLQSFFDLMISDFKAKHGKFIIKENPDYLLSRISNFIEKKYAHGGPLNTHERFVLSRVLYERGDITFMNSIKASETGKSKGKLGYFK